MSFSIGFGFIIGMGLAIYKLYFLEHVLNQTDGHNNILLVYALPAIFYGYRRIN
ncbi:MAG: hypothetical protein HC778_05990 [Chamaesiphon sp. CSU_1_12]|nr:hypothetical protein [Chamaesiphon sp. CSU_1_12]